MGSNTKKEPMFILDIICYCKVGTALTEWGAKVRSQILLSQYWRNKQFDFAQKL